MSSFKIASPTGSISFRKPQQFLNAAYELFNQPAEDPDLTFAVDGVEMPLVRAMAAAEDLRDAEDVKRLKTHKQIWVHNGASNAANTWKLAWVRR